MIHRIVPLGLPLLVFGVTGCNALFTGLMGMHSTPPHSPARVAADAARYRVPAAQVAVLDASYLRFVRRQAREASRYDAAKNHGQLLQLLYFDAAGRLVSFHINCYAPPKLPSLNLNWNPDGLLNTFPPASQVAPDQLLSFAQLLTFLRTPEGQPLAAEPLAVAPGGYRVVVFWSHTMGRQTRVLLRAVAQNLQRVPPGQPAPQVLYVNNDAYLGLLD
ncbi:hypothetical protein LJ737_04685 [Hymenobacter sp. 15J16-1T3B]|nr:hypothetical protein [Hymenobacter sp. 15J16-1T3B]